MSTNSAIEWTDATWNPVVGCSRVSAGCDHCYAVGMTRRLQGMSKAGPNPGKGRTAQYVGLTVQMKPAAIEKGIGVNGWHFNGTVRTVEAALEIPLRWREPRMIFVNSMSDLFHEKVPFEFIDRVFAVMALCPQHTFQVLTKRPERMAEYMTRREISKAWSPSVRAGDGGNDDFKYKTPCDRVYTIARQMKGRDAAPALIWPLPNVWLGTSIENRDARSRVYWLGKCPAAVRFVSAEPLLGELDLRLVADNNKAFINWVIVGGESGPGARPCDVDWIRSIRDQCKSAGVACFIKQLGTKPWDGMTPRDICGERDENYLHLKDRKGGDINEWPEDLRIVREFPKTERAA